MQARTTSIFGPLTERLDRPSRGRQRVLILLAWTVGLFALVETAAQWREYRITGNTIVNRLIDRPDWVLDAQYGVRLLRPNAVIAGQVQNIRSNSLGLRSTEMPARPAPAEHRIAVLGASSVMGAYSRTNDDTLPVMLQVYLRNKLPGVTVNVINAGISGYGLEDQRRMLDYVADKLAPEMALVYSGANDFTGYCAAQRASVPVNPHRLPQLELPGWLLSIDLLRKNTVALRPTTQASSARLNVAALDVSGYRSRLEALVRAAQARGLPLVLATNARSYRRDQPPAVQEVLARSARYYADCFDLEGLHVLYERHNAVIEEVAARLGVPVLPVGDRMPGGPAYFQDSVHFTSLGKQRVANLFADFVAARYGKQWGAEP